MLRLWPPLLLLPFAACGGDSGDSADARPSDARVTQGRLPTTTVAALGDSITAGSPLWDPDPARRLEIGPAATPRSQYQYWAAGYRRLADTVALP